MLATDLAAYLGTLKGYQVVALPKAKLDVTRRDDIAAALQGHKPDLVVNTAVFHVEDSENDPERAFAVNAWAARLLAQEVAMHGATLVQISTCGLFGDEVRPYNEYDPVTLKTAYARSKHAGDEYARQYGKDSFILRLGWLYGGGVEHRRNFVAARYREAMRKPALESAGDKYGSPTYTGNVAAAIPALLESGEYGLYHLANEGGCSRADYVRAIVEAFGLETRVTDVDSSHFPRRAPVPDCEMLTSYNLAYAGLPALPPWREALERYVHGIRSSLQ